MATNSRIGNKYSANRPSNIILPRAKSLAVQTIKTWKDSRTLALLPEGANRLPILQVYDSLKIDSNLISITESRILRILGSKFKIVNEKGEEQPEVTKLFKSKWFAKFLEHAMWSRFMGSTVVELWDLDDELYLTDCNLIPRENCLFNQGLIVKEVGDEKGYPYKEGNFLNNYIQIGDDWDLGIYADVAPDVLSKKLAFAAWNEFVERYGIAPRTVTTDSHNPQRHNELADMMASMVNNHWAILQGNEKLDIINTQGNDAYNTFEKLITRRNSEMAKRILGQDNTTGTGDSKGTYGSMKILQDVAEDRHDSDKSFIENLVNDELLWRLQQISPKYGIIKDNLFAWDDTKELTPKELIDLVSSLNGAGYIVDPEYIEEKTSLPIIGRSQNNPEPDQGEKKKPKLNALIKSELNSLYTSFKGNLKAPEIEATADNLAPHFDKWVKDIYYNKDTPRVYWPLAEATANVLVKAIEKEVKVEAAATLEDSFYANLQSNLFVFSAAKSFTQYVELRDLLIDQDGKIKPYHKFKAEAKALHRTYNVNHLKTEYQNALRNAQMAAKWQDFEATKHLYDLQFDTAGDSKVRDDHKDYEGITRPVDDSFWNRHYPPLDWNCRCTVRKVAKGTPLTPVEKLRGIPKPPKQFQNNVGKQQLIFSNDHPHIKNMVKNKEEELQAVRDYGLQGVKKIFNKSKTLATPKERLKSLQEAEDWFAKNADKNKLKVKIGKEFTATLTKERFNHITKSKPKEQRWAWINNLAEMLQNAHEVYLLNYTGKLKNYRFITYFTDHIRIVNTDDKFKVITAYESTLEQAEKQREGILLSSKK